jgi:HK97 family phage portal protein
MGLERLLRRQEQRSGPIYYSLPGGMGGYTAAAYAGGSVELALRNAASWACIDVLADGVSRTPLDAMRGGNQQRIPVSPPPTVLARPSGVVLKDVWRYQLAWSLLTDGNCFAKIVTMSAGGWPQQMEILDPCSVTERKVVNGVSQVKVDQETYQLWPAGMIWHVPGRMVPAGSPFGLSPVDYARNAIGTSLSAEDFSQRFFTDGGHPSSVIYANRELNETQAQSIKDAWRRATSGNREVAVLGGNLKHEQIQVDPSDSQFIDLMRFEVEQACRFWRVPPTMVYAASSGQSVTYANVTQNDLSYLKNSLDGYLVRIEEALTDILPRPQYVKANRNAVLRADPAARQDYYTKALTNRTITVNEVRALEDQAPFGTEFDVPGIPPIGAKSTERDIAEMVQNIYLGVGIVLTDEEARQILTDAGADLPGALPQS